MVFAPFTILSIEATLHNLKTTAHGLTLEEARRRLEQAHTQEQRNLPTWINLLLRQLFSPFTYLLAGAALISFILKNTFEAGFILVFILINTLLGFSQEYHSNKALEALKQFVVKKTRVRRQEQDYTLLTSETVVGDIILLVAGDIVPADARLIESQALTVDESALTGESIHVGKHAGALSRLTEQPFEAKNILFSGTTIISGQATAVVIALGKDTVIGEVSHLTQATKHVSGFEKGISKFSRFILRLVIITLVTVFLLHLVFRRAELQPLELLIFSLALAVSVIPEALPIVTTISLSKGGLRLAKQGVVVKRLSAIEDLGSIEVLCTDKTGTITENRLRVEEVYADNIEATRRYATLGSNCLGDSEPTSNNAFDIALWQTWTEEEQRALRQVICKSSIPFDPERKRSSRLIYDNTTHYLLLRGAPEAIFPHCLLSKNDQDKLLSWCREQGQQGRRVLAIAHKAMGDAETYTLAQEDQGFTYAGLIAFADPVKPSTRRAIQDAQHLGIAVKILTGDSSDVAGSVAQKIGLISSGGRVITGAEFEELDPTERKEVVRKYHVFARVSPAQKHAIIQELKQHFEVGFLGEGINDAPALRAANVGIVVQGASDVAREAADIVLLQQSLGVVVRGIREGREVFGNTLKYIKATLAANFGNFYAMAISTFFIRELPMLPLQILLVNLLSDFPMIAIATDRVDPVELKRPRTYNVRDIIKIATLLGCVSTVFDFLIFGLFAHLAPHILQTNWFIGSILTELIFMYSIRTQLPFWKAMRPSAAIIILTLFAAAATITLPYTFVGQHLFQFHPPSITHLGIIFGITLAFFATTESVKLAYQKYQPTLS